jgi:hypothetical protein
MGRLVKIIVVITVIKGNFEAKPIAIVKKAAPIRLKATRLKECVPLAAKAMIVADISIGDKNPNRGFK